MSQQETSELKSILESFKTFVKEEFASVNKKLDKISADVESIDRVISFREKDANLNGLKDSKLKAR